jgi:hypothetical protein
MSVIWDCSWNKIIPIRSPGLRRILFVGVDSVEESNKRRMNPTEPVVAARWLLSISIEKAKKTLHGAYRGTWLALSFALIYQEAG